MDKIDFKVDWCTHEAAKYACEHWHYSKCMPVGKMVKIGVWENNNFIGCIIFSRGACHNLGNEYNLKMNDVCELTRIALNKHKTQVSKILKISFIFLRKTSSNLKLIYSYADPRQNHYGGVYQATNWIYVGLSIPGGSLEYFYKGKWRHSRTMITYSKDGIGLEFAKKNNIKIRKPTRKYKYLMPLTKDMRKKILPLAKPYPKREQNADKA